MSNVQRNVIQLCENGPLMSVFSGIFFLFLSFLVFFFLLLSFFLITDIFTRATLKKKQNKTHKQFLPKTFIKILKYFLQHSQKYLNISYSIHKNTFDKGNECL